MSIWDNILYYASFGAVDNRPPKAPTDLQEVHE